MGDVQHGHIEAAIEPRKQFQDFGLGHRIESAGGLIGNQQRGTVQNGHGNQQPLCLSHAQLRRITAQKRFFRRQADAVQQIQKMALTAVRAPLVGMCQPGFVQQRAQAQCGIERSSRALRH